MSEETRIPIHEMVICDLCSKDYSSSDETGGFIISWGQCALLAPQILKEN